MTLQGRLAWTRGEAGPDAYDGRGPVELGLRYAVIQADQGVVSLYLGGVMAGAGRNAGYAPPGAGETSVEARLLAGRSASLRGRPVFVEIQAARLLRSGLADETRLDLTAGLEPASDWLLLAQTYSGWTDADPQWTKLEVSLVRRFGAWRVQGGWRGSVTGKASPVEDGPVLGVWRDF